MAKSYSLTFVSLCLLTLGSCQSIEQISIDYLQPAELSFPPELRRVAIVNNTSDTPDNKLVYPTEDERTITPEVWSATAYANGDVQIATESLAESIANQNYFDKVVICDSALRAHDILPRESTLSQEEVIQLTSDLDVDFIIALENLQLTATKSIRYLPEFNIHQSDVDVKVYPTISIYLPRRNRPISTLHLNDSIFWEDFGNSYTAAGLRIISDKQLLEESSDFAGTIPTKYLVPIWQQATRYLYSSGSVQMRDAAVYARENSWDKAQELWLQAFEDTKKNKKKMRAALNIAVYYEMKDSLNQAEEWAVKAQELARETNKADTLTVNGRSYIDADSDYFHISLYATKLKERNAQRSKLNIQMSRFDDDF